MIRREDVLKQLKEVYDPELHFNVVDLGLIYDVAVKGNDVYILMTLTFPGCPLGGVIHEEIQDKVGRLEGVGKVNLKITFDPPWDLTKVSDKIRTELGLL